METYGRYVKKSVNISEAYNALLADFETNDITNSLNPDPYCDSNQNYNTFHDHISHQTKREALAIQICKI